LHISEIAQVETVNISIAIATLYISNSVFDWLFFTPLYQIY